MKILWIFLEGHHKIRLYLGVISMHFLGLFLKVKVQNGGILGGLLKFQIFLGVLEIPVFCFFVFLLLFFFWGGVNGRCWARTYV